MRPNVQLLLDSLTSAKTAEEVAEIQRQLEAAAAEIDESDSLGGMSQVERERLKTEEAQEIGPLPAVKNPARKDSCRFDLRQYMLTYFRAACSFRLADGTLDHKGFAPYQEEMIAAFQDVILHGDRKSVV